MSFEHMTFSAKRMEALDSNVYIVLMKMLINKEIL